VELESVPRTTSLNVAQQEWKCQVSDSSIEEQSQGYTTGKLTVRDILERCTAVRIGVAGDDPIDSGRMTLSINLGHLICRMSGGLVDGSVVLSGLCKKLFCQIFVSNL
jgi:hypothetical protein